MNIHQMHRVTRLFFTFSDIRVHAPLFRRMMRRLMRGAPCYPMYCHAYAQHMLDDDAVSILFDSFSALLMLC